MLYIPSYLVHIDSGFPYMHAKMHLDMLGLIYLKHKDTVKHDCYSLIQSNLKYTLTTSVLCLI